MFQIAVIIINNKNEIMYRNNKRYELSLDYLVSSVYLNRNDQNPMKKVGIYYMIK